jgi:hypothetical protein
MTIWRNGSFQFNFGEKRHGCHEGGFRMKHAQASVTEQDVLIEYFRQHRDSFHSLDKCYNYRGTLLARERCGECQDGKCDNRVKVLHIAKLLKWMDMSAWQIHSWRGMYFARPTPAPPAKVAGNRPVEKPASRTQPASPNVCACGDNVDSQAHAGRFLRIPPPGAKETSSFLRPRSRQAEAKAVLRMHDGLYGIIVLQTRTLPL